MRVDHYDVLAISKVAQMPSGIANQNRLLSNYYDSKPIR